MYGGKFETGSIPTLVAAAQLPTELKAVCNASHAASSSGGSASLIARACDARVDASAGDSASSARRGGLVGALDGGGRLVATLYRLGGRSAASPSDQAAELTRIVAAIPGGIAELARNGQLVYKDRDDQLQPNRVPSAG
ncbi:hypothetical protein WOLCODRAFT_150882 [Wolfiporia cocos MD-104 SS10]|uniref:Uncharacterized protein n=1 Tax=Wolfiporia cocos (strain MD-104) TaxID=742152 RepID=A0A2H3JXF3_WOLCO|nr:hypothetical protein WOLCODRAFT_150882 [Wolfiporia cocos MD-104 SS10]